MARFPRIRRLSDSKGANLLEAALITPLLLLLTLAIVDFSLLFYAHLALENGVSQATRFAITGQTMEDPGNPGSPLSRTDSIKTAMRRATPTLTISDSAFTFSHMPEGSTTWQGGTGGPNAIERVTVNYVWTPYTPLMRPFFTGGQVILRVASTMKNESRFE
jgi:Flp pilus assembly protein TadG